MVLTNPAVDCSDQQGRGILNGTKQQPSPLPASAASHVRLREAQNLCSYFEASSITKRSRMEIRFIVEWFVVFKRM